MFSTIRTQSKLLLTTFVFALAASGCARDAHPLVAAAKHDCAAGEIRNAADAGRYSSCEEVQGNLRISAPELTGLSALAGLRAVSGTLEISGNCRLDDLTGLERLEQVGALDVHDNADLDDLSGLESLRRARRVSIRENRELESLRGLSGLSHLEALTIERNGLFQAGGLANLAYVGELRIEGNARLNSLQGLSSLQHARSVEIHDNPRLCARGMLPALARVDRAVTVTQNRGLSELDVRGLLGRIEHGVIRPDLSDLASLDAALR
jgi:hypothetical protein